MVKTFHYGISVVGKCLHINIQPLIDEWKGIYNHLVKYKGRTYAIKYCKELNTVAERYALHQPIDPISFTKSNKEGFPKILNKFKTYLRSSDPEKVMLTLSVFRTIEELRLPVSKDISTVTDPPSWNRDILESVIKFIPLFVQSIKPLKVRRMNYHLSIKNGPNGHALQTSDLDTRAIQHDQQLLNAIRVTEEKLSDKDQMIIKDDLPENGKEPILSRLTQFPEKSGKTRTIAVIDYYSQRSLKTLHSGLMDLLGTLKSDGTYSHMNVGKFAKQKTEEKSYIYCADLTAATDRFPKEIQKALLFELLKDDDLAEAYWTILADRTFTTAWSGEQVRYNTGQPMGAYASWALFALAHHLIVQFAAYKTATKGINDNYKIIGDDVIIAEEATAKYYRYLMEGLGLTINKGKTVESLTGRYSSAEVAKQLYLNGTCLTPLTPGIIRDLMKPYMFNTCIGLIKERYDYLDPKFWPELIDSLFPREKVNQLVWVLTSNPLDGNIKPTDVGYDISSPWMPINSAEMKDKYITIFNQRFKKQVEDQLYDLEDYLAGFPGSPLGDYAKSQPPTRATSIIIKTINKVLEKYSYDGVDLRADTETEVLMKDEFPYIPNPCLPFVSRRELKCKRLSSLIEQTFNQIRLETV